MSGLIQFAPRQNFTTETDFREFLYEGEAMVRGIEGLLQKRSGRHTGWLSYTLAEREDTFPSLAAGPFPADQDQRHEVKVVNVFELGAWKLSGTWVYASGKPYTQPAGIEPFVLPSGATADRVVVETKNDSRLPAYHRLDLALSREVSLGGRGRRKGSFGVTLFNLYNRRNTWYKEFNAVEGEIIENDITLMGLTVNAFVALTF